MQNRDAGDVGDFGKYGLCSQREYHHTNRSTFVPDGGCVLIQSAIFTANW